MTQRPFVPWVHYLRGIAAMMVVLHHVAFRLHLQSGSPAEWFPSGSSGVDLFFVISGFVMQHVSAGRHGEHSAPSTFIRERAARVLPVYWLATLLAVVARAAIGLGTPWPVIAVSTLLIPSQATYVLANGWTLSYEMAFYALLALSLLLPSRSAERATIAVLVGLAALGWLLKPEDPVGSFATASLYLEFVFGMLVYRAYAAGRRLTRPGWIALLCVGLSAWWATAADGWMVDRALSWGLPAAIVLSALVLGNPTVGIAGRTLGVLGDASFSLYLVHPLVVGAYTRVAGEWHPAGGPQVVLAAALMTAASVGAAIAFHQTIEAPLVQWTRRILGTVPTAAFGRRR